MFFNRSELISAHGDGLSSFVILCILDMIELKLNFEDKSIKMIILKTVAPRHHTICADIFQFSDNRSRVIVLLHRHGRTLHRKNVIIRYEVVGQSVYIAANSFWSDRCL